MRFLVPGTEEEARHRADVLARAVHDPAARAQVDSGRLAEPFWYVDSPLTTPIRAGRSPAARRAATSRSRRPASWCRTARSPCPAARTSSGCGSWRAPDHAAARRRRSVPGSHLAAGTTGRRPPDARPRPGSDAPRGLGARPDETWVLRPDAHVAAVATCPADVAAAVSRIQAMPEADSGS